MKSIFIALAVLTGISCFAETFDYLKYQELQKVARETKTAATTKAANDYVINSTLSGLPQSDALQLRVIIPLEFDKARVIPTVEQIKKTIDEKFTAFDATGTMKESILVVCLIKYNYIDELLKIDEERFAPQACRFYLQKKDYDKAIKYGEISKDRCSYPLIQAYTKRGEKQKIWELGKYMFFETYIADANHAMMILKAMVNTIPSDVTNEQVAAMLKAIGDKYPTPGTDFETWKGFMGFVGYKYKALTGKDLFTATEAAK